MKILIVNSYDFGGGAAIAALRLHEALLASGMESLMLVQRKNTVHPTVISPGGRLAHLRTLLCSRLNGLWLRRLYPNRAVSLFSPARFNNPSLIKRINNEQPDIVHLHWLQHDLLSVEDLKKIKAPIVWSLHDNWAFTGGCHLKWDCTRYQKGCGHCPNLGSHRYKDLSRRVFNRKQTIYAQLKPMTIVGLSRWIHQEAKNSLLLKTHRHVCLPNPIDTAQFQPSDAARCRVNLNLPPSAYILYAGEIEDPNKGFDLLLKALEFVGDKNITVLATADKPKNFELPPNVPPFHFIGRISRFQKWLWVLNAVKMTVVPSRQETLPNVIMESMACSTPAVAFDVGGNSDLINHKENGYLAPPLDIKALSQGIQWVMTHPNYTVLCHNAQTKIKKQFEAKSVAQKYIRLYREILETQSTVND